MTADVWIGVLAIGGGFALALGVFLILLRRAGAAPAGRLKLTVELAVLALAIAACGAIAAIDGVAWWQAAQAGGDPRLRDLVRFLTPLLFGVLLTRITIRTFGLARRAWAARGSE